MTTQYINSREARKNFSELINSVGVLSDSYTVSVRNNPKAVLVDIDTANEYLPQRYIMNNKMEPTAGELFFKRASAFIVKKSPGQKKVNISGNIDKILYGI